MTKQEIQDVVRMTIDELTDRKLLSENDDVNYCFIGDRIRKHYRGHPDERIQKALGMLQHDPYFRIIPDYYRFDHTITHIGVDIGCDRATVCRNKRRLALMIYDIAYRGTV